MEKDNSSITVHISQDLTITTSVKISWKRISMILTSVQSQSSQHVPLYAIHNKHRSKVRRINNKVFLFLNTIKCKSVAKKKAAYYFCSSLSQEEGEFKAMSMPLNDVVCSQQPHHQLMCVHILGGY